MTTVITTSASVACGHKGKVPVGNPPGPSKLVVAHQPVAVAAGVPTWKVVGCPAASGSNPAPCLTVQPPSAGTATKLTVGGSAVLLQTLQATTVGAPPPPPPLSATVTAVTSTKLSAV